MQSARRNETPRVTWEAASTTNAATRIATTEPVVCHDLDGLAVQRNDAHRMLIIDGMWVRLAPLEYQVILPLIVRFNRPVPADTICQEAFGCAYSSSEERRLYRHIDRARPKLAAFGLAISSLNKKRGYMLLRDEAPGEGNRSEQISG